MTDYTWPSTVIPTSSEWQLVANTAAFVSPLSGTTRTLARGGSRWACSLSCRNLRAEKRATLLAFLTRLEGQRHRVVLPDHAFVKRGTLAVNPLVKGGGQTGNSLAVDGATAAKTLLAGDWISVGGLLYMVADTATVDGAGEASIPITPRLRSAPGDNATVTVVSPTGRFLLSGNTLSWSNAAGGRAGVLSTVVVDLVEDIA